MMKAAEKKMPPERRPLSLILHAEEPLQDVERYVQLAYNPSVHAYNTLKVQIEQSSPRWLWQFLECGGFDAFLDTLCQLTGHKFTNFSDAVLQLDCLSCVKAVLNSPVGMHYCIQYEEAMRKLMQALDTPNTLPKKLVFELMTAMAMYSKQGHEILIASLEGFKRDKNYEHRFSLIINELKNSETATYRVTLMSLVNVILRGYDDVKERARARDQLIALRLLDVMGYIRRDDREPELAIQFEVFDTDKHVDEQLLQSSHGLDMTSHEELFGAVYNKTFCTPSSGYLLHILQDLFHMETSSCVHHSEEKWSAIAKVVKLIVNMKGDTECTEFLNLLKKHGDEQKTTDTKKQRTSTFKANSNHSEKKKKYTHRRCQSESRGDSKLTLVSTDEKRDSFPDSSTMSSDKPHGTSNYSDTGRDVNRQDSGISVTSMYDMDGLFRRQSSGRSSFGAREKLRHQDIKPQKPVKVVKWSPIRMKDAYKPLSMWKILQEKSHRTALVLNYKSLEDEFEVPQTRDTEHTDAGDETHLLDPSESLCLNLLLARLEAMPEELADSVLQCDPSDLNPHSVDLLMAAMPPEHQLLRIQQYKGPRFALAPAEQFLGFICENSDYPVLLEGLKFKVNFIDQFPKVKDAFDATITSCRDILHNFGLRDFVRAMLEAGNFLNAGSNLEPVAGVKLQSWKSLSGVKGQGHDSNLLEFLVRYVEQKDPDILMFVDDFPALEKATSFSTESLKKEVTDLNLQLKQLLQVVSKSKRETKDLFQEFVEDVKSELAGLHGSIARLRGLSSQMALYFCEDELTFDLKACLTTLHEFISIIKNCKKDSCLLRQQKEVAMKRKVELKKKMEDAHIMNFFGKKADLCSSFARSQEDALVDHILREIHRGQIVYHQEEEPKTPDTTHGADATNQAFVISAIPRLISTPVDNLDIDLESDSFIFQGATLGTSAATMAAAAAAAAAQANQNARRTYVDKVESVIDRKYHREKQMESGSFLNQGQTGQLQPMDPPSFIPSSSKDFQIKIYPKLGIPNLAQPPMPAYRPARRGHQRTCSDLDRSTIVDRKWVAYEQDKGEAPGGRGQPVRPDNVESKNMLMSLGLEKGGKTIQDADIQEVHVDKCPTTDVKPTGSKKKRISLLQRFSNVLRQRNTNVMDDNKGQGHAKVTPDPPLSKDLTRGSKRWSGRARKSKKVGVAERENKENVRVEGHVIDATEI